VCDGRRLCNTRCPCLVIVIFHFLIIFTNFSGSSEQLSGVYVYACLSAYLSIWTVTFEQICVCLNTNCIKFCGNDHGSVDDK